MMPVVAMTRRRRNVALACCAVGAGGYLTYRLYTSASVARKRRKIVQFFGSLSSFLEVFAQGGDCIRFVWKDLDSFLRSDTDDVPHSLRQLMKVSQCQEFHLAVLNLTRSVTNGVVSGLSDGYHLHQKGSNFESSSFENRRRESLKNRENRQNVESGYLDTKDGMYAWKSWRSRSDGERDEQQDGEISEELGILIEEFPESNFRRDDVNLANDEDAWKLKEENVELEGDGKVLRFTRSKSLRTQLRETRKSNFPSQGVGHDASRAGDLTDRLSEKLFSKAGRGFASAIVACATRSLVFSILEGIQVLKTHEDVPDGDDWRPRHGNSCRAGGMQFASGQGSSHQHSILSSGIQDELIEFACSSRGKTLIADCIESFVGTAVTVYLDRTKDVNFYEDMVASMVKPDHRAPVTEILTSVCNGAIDTLVRTSHQVISVGSSRPSTKEPATGMHSPRGPHFCHREKSRVVGFGYPSSVEESRVESFPISGQLDALSSLSGVLETDRPSEQDNVSTICPVHSVPHERGWIDGISRTLAVPSNRALVLDLAGAMSSEAVRSFFEVFISKFSHIFRGKGTKTTQDGQSREILSPGDRGLMTWSGEFTKASAAKAMVVMTVCLAIFLHSLIDARVLKPF